MDVGRDEGHDEDEDAATDAAEGEDMARIEAITRYVFEGREFQSLDGPDGVRRYIEAQIGALIDSGPLRLHPRDRMSIFNAILQHRVRLSVLLAAFDEGGWS